MTAGIVSHPCRYYDQLCAMESKLPIAEDKVCTFLAYSRAPLLFTASSYLSPDQHSIHMV